MSLLLSNRDAQRIERSVRKSERDRRSKVAKRSRPTQGVVMRTAKITTQPVGTVATMGCKLVDEDNNPYGDEFDVYLRSGRWAINVNEWWPYPAVGWVVTIALVDGEWLLMAPNPNYVGAW